MKEISRRNALGIIAGSGMSVSVAGAKEGGNISTRNGGSSRFGSLSRPDLTVINNTKYERNITVSLRDDAGNRIPVVQKSLAGVRSPADAVFQQVAQPDVAVPREGVYTVQVAVDGELTAERALGLSERGLPDNKSIIIDVDSEETTIALSVV